MVTKPYLRIGLVALITGVIAACKQTPVTLEDHYTAHANHDLEVDRPAGDAHMPVVEPEKWACPSEMLDFDDMRLDKSVMGLVGGRIVNAPPEIEEWFGSAFATIMVEGRKAGEAAAQPAGGLGLEVALRKAWAQSVNSSMTATLVVEVRYLRSGSLVKQATYRGDDVSLNWASGHTEIQRHFNVAMQQVLEAVRVDLVGLCDRGSLVALHASTGGPVGLETAVYPNRSAP